MNKMIVDVDGVLADSVPKALDWFNYQFDTHYIPSDIDKWNPELVVNGGEKVSFADWMVAHMKDPSFHRDIRALPGARIVLEDALEDGWIITLATARAPETEGLTRQWLAWNGIPYSEIIHEEEKHILSGDLLIEDNLQNVFDWNGWFRGGFPLRPALLVDTTYNQSHWLPWPIRRVRDWVDIDAYLGDPQDGLHV